MFHIVALFLLGLIIGSFLNVVIARMRTLETILGRSFCRHCRKKIRWYDNIPLLSFVVLGGKCRDCKDVISWQYPVVEFATASLFALFGAAFFFPGDPVSWMETAWILGVLAVSVVLFAYDLKYMEIPMTVLWFGILWTGIFLFWLDWAQVQSVVSVFALRLHSGFIAGLLAFFAFFLMASLSRERWMGLGDAYIAFFMGLVLGWPSIWSALLIAFTSGALVGVALMFVSDLKLKSKLPFAPFLLFGMTAVLFVDKVFPSWKDFFGF